MTIYKKVLLLIAIPLLAQAVFIGILLRAQAEGIRAQLWAVHTKEVIAKVEETYRRLLEGYARLRNVIASGNRSVTDRLDPALDQIPGKIAAIKVLVRDNLPQQARIDELAAGSQAFLELLAAQESMLKAGDSDRAFELLEEGARVSASSGPASTRSWPTKRSWTGSGRIDCGGRACNCSGSSSGEARPFWRRPQLSPICCSIEWSTGLLSCETTRAGSPREKA